MDSSFLTGIHIGLGLFACILFLKLVIQFGLPNHPARFVSYVVGLCVAAYFVGLGLTDLNIIPPWDWVRWRALPLIAGSLCLLFQTIVLVGNFSLLQQKVMSRLPIIASLICFAFFAVYADAFMSSFLIIGGVFLIILVNKARHQTRLYVKMLLMFSIHLGLSYLDQYWAYVSSQVFLFFVIFYVFLFEHSFGVAAMVDDFKGSLEGDRR